MLKRRKSAFSNESFRGSPKRGSSFKYAMPSTKVTATKRNEALMKHRARVRAGSGDMDEEDEDDPLRGVERWKKSVRKVMFAQRLLTTDAERERKLEEKDKREGRRTTIAMRFKRRDADSARSIESIENGYSQEMKYLFFLKSPEIYYETVRITIMMISFYHSLWIVNYLPLAIHQLHSTSWAILSLLPGVMSFICYIYTIKCAGMMKGLVYIDVDTIEETIEAAESSRALGVIVKDRLLARVHDKDQPEDELYALFMEIDDNGSGLLSRKEFQMFLEAVGITFSAKRWRMIFNEIDRDFDDEISFNEFLLYLYPDHEKSKVSVFIVVTINNALLLEYLMSCSIVASRTRPLEKSKRGIS